MCFCSCAPAFDPGRRLTSSTRHNETLAADEDKATGPAPIDCVSSPCRMGRPCGTRTRSKDRYTRAELEQLAAARGISHRGKTMDDLCKLLGVNVLTSLIPNLAALSIARPVTPAPRPVPTTEASNVKDFLIRSGQRYTSPRAPWEAGSRLEEAMALGYVPRELSNVRKIPTPVEVAPLYQGLRSLRRSRTVDDDELQRVAAEWKSKGAHAYEEHYNDQSLLQAHRGFRALASLFERRARRPPAHLRRQQAALHSIPRTARQEGFRAHAWPSHPQPQILVLDTQHVRLTYLQCSRAQRRHSLPEHRLDAAGCRHPFQDLAASRAGLRKPLPGR